MSAVEKAEVLARVASSSVPKREVLSELGVPRSTYYRWLRGREQEGIEDHAGGGKPPWNRLTSRGSRPRSVGGQGDAGAESTTAGLVGHRQHGVLGIGVYGLSHPPPVQGGSGEEA